MHIWKEMESDTDKCTFNRQWRASRYGTLSKWAQQGSCRQQTFPLASRAERRCRRLVATPGELDQTSNKKPAARFTTDLMIYHKIVLSSS